MIKLNQEIELLKSILANNGSFLPAPFDMPTEEHLGVDVHQMDDDKAIKELGDNIALLIEENQKSKITQSFDEKTYYFIDGTFTTKKIGEFVSNRGSNTFPVLLSEIISAVVAFDKEHKFKQEAVKKKIYLIFPPKEQGIMPDVLERQLDEYTNKEINTFLGNVEITFLDKEVQDITNILSSMRGKARALMHDLESNLARDILNEKSSSDNVGYIFIDGSIRKPSFLIDNKIIGIAKSFSRKPRFIRKNSNTPLSVNYVVRELKPGFRTGTYVFDKEKEKNKKVGFFYLKLRNYPPLEPLGGVVKVEYLIDDNIDNISEKAGHIASIIKYFGANSVYPYPRWPSFIYPIRLTEEIMNAHKTHKDLLGKFAELLITLDEGGYYG